MKGMLELKKSAVIAAVCMAMLCVSGCNKPTPEQVAEKEQEKALKGGETMIEKFLHNGKYVKIYGRNAGYSYISATSIYSIYITENSVEICYDAAGVGSLRCDVNEYGMSLDKDCNLMVKPRKGVVEQERAELLFKAIEKKDVEWAKLCIKLGADVNKKDSLGNTALMRAAYNNKDIVELLINSGADVNAKGKDGSTALMNASNNKDIAELLIKAGADVNAIDNAGRTALTFALYSNKEDVAELLVHAISDRGAALIWAAKKGHYRAVKFLIDAGADVNAKDSEGLSVLTHAMLYGNKDIEKLLRDAGAKE